MALLIHPPSKESIVLTGQEQLLYGNIFNNYRVFMHGILQLSTQRIIFTSNYI